MTSPSVSVPLVDEDPSDVEEDEELHEDNDTSSELQGGVHVCYPHTVATPTRLPSHCPPHGYHHTAPHTITITLPPPQLPSHYPPTLSPSHCPPTLSPSHYPPHRWSCTEQECHNAYAVSSENWNGSLQDSPAYLHPGEEVTTGDVGGAILTC